MTRVKKTYPNITTIIGGVHATISQTEVLTAGCFDIVVVGEADFALSTILSSKAPGELSMKWSICSSAVLRKFILPMTVSLKISLGLNKFVDRLSGENLIFLGL